MRILCCLAVCLAVNGSAQSTENTSGTIAFVRAKHLRRGINASEWFAQVYDKHGCRREHFENWTTSDDIALLKSMDFDHVRLSINPQPMLTAGEWNNLPPDYIGALDRAVKMILDQDLAVIIDIHPDDDFKLRLAKDDDMAEQYSDLWRALAAHYSTWDPDRIFLEILNEPEFSDRYRWMGVQMGRSAATPHASTQR
jgi:aryl-phospho-beta-D-glucosidase BglC (GH1 family)